MSESREAGGTIKRNPLLETPWGIFRPLAGRDWRPVPLT
jgi:hypothetical protein